MIDPPVADRAAALVKKGMHEDVALLVANAVAIQHIKLENEGWDRDVSVTEPTRPS
jgi:hypothetical protein